MMLRLLVFIALTVGMMALCWWFVNRRVMGKWFIAGLVAYYGACALIRVVIQ